MLYFVPLSAGSFSCARRSTDTNGSSGDPRGAADEEDRQGASATSREGLKRPPSLGLSERLGVSSRRWSRRAAVSLGMASRRLLEKLGEAALRSSWVNGKWQKAAISAKKAARLRREDLVAGK